MAEYGSLERMHGDGESGKSAVTAVVRTTVVVVPREWGCIVREYRGYGDSGHDSTAGTGAIN